MVLLPAAAPNAAFILLAEFNIDSGSGLKHQFPRATGASELVLADMMLPDGAHDRAEDWTLFTLNQTAGLATVSSDPPDAPSNSRQGQEPLHVISLVRTRKDDTVRRGAVCKAMAICSRHPFIQIFKPILLLGLEDYFADPSIECLARVFEAVNAMKMDGVPALSYHEKLVLRASDRKDLFEEKFAAVAAAARLGEPDALPSAVPKAASRQDANDYPDVTPGQASLGVAEPQSAQDSAAAVQGDLSARRPRDTHWFDTFMSYRNRRIPVRIPMQTFPSEIGEYSLIKLVQTFSSPNALDAAAPTHPHLHSNGPSTHPIVLLFNALITQKRVVFLGHGQPAGTVAEFVLAACALGSGCGAVLDGFLERAFPYSNLTIFEDFQAVPGYIAGVTNPIFELHGESWDVFCNIETGKITVSKALLTDASAERPSGDPITPVGDTGGSIAASRADGKDSMDNVFMEEITQAISAHFGEAVVRSRFTDYVQRFIRLASRHEETVYGATSIGPPCRPFSGDELGSGIVFADESSAKREMQANAGRIEAWFGTESYRLYKLRHMTTRQTLFSFDLQHQLARLRSARKVPDQEVALLFDTLARELNTEAEVVEALAQMPPHLGGLLPLAFGLLHPSDAVRVCAVDVFRRLEAHPTGRKFFQQLGTFFRLAYLRQSAERRPQARNSGVSAV